MASTFSGVLASGPPLAWTFPIVGMCFLMVPVNFSTFLFRSRMDSSESIWPLSFSFHNP